MCDMELGTLGGLWQAPSLSSFESNHRNLNYKGYAILMKEWRVATFAVNGWRCSSSTGLRSILQNEGLDDYASMFGCNNLR